MYCIDFKINKVELKRDGKKVLKREENLDNIVDNLLTYDVNFMNNELSFHSNLFTKIFLKH